MNLEWDVGDKLKGFGSKEKGNVAHGAHTFAVNEESSHIPQLSTGLKDRKS